MKICTQCHIALPETMFYKNGKRLQSVCKLCHKSNIQHAYLNKIQQINEYKSCRGCRKCGDTRFYVLDFHHINSNDKEFSISDKVRVKFEHLIPEMDKCDILCANCHRE